jgi:Response regulator of the LytR/AlgR family
MNLRCIAIDDEPFALQQMRSYIEKTPFLIGQAFCSNAQEALEKIHENPVDLIFVDINMPEITGVEFAKSLNPEKMIVFTTAYSEYALEGFQVNAVDYLLKPISYADFLKSANKAKYLFDLKSQQESLQESEDSIFVKSEYRSIRVRFDNIRYIEGMREYVRIHLSNGKPIMTLLSMKVLEEKLPSNQFMRIHRSFIINRNKIDAIEKNRVILENGKYIPIGGLYKDTFQQYLDKRF